MLLAVFTTETPLNSQLLRNLPHLSVTLTPICPKPQEDVSCVLFSEILGDFPCTQAGPATCFCVFASCLCLSARNRPAEKAHRSGSRPSFRLPPPLPTSARLSVDSTSTFAELSTKTSTPEHPSIQIKICGTPHAPVTSPPFTRARSHHKFTADNTTLLSTLGSRRVSPLLQGFPSSRHSDDMRHGRALITLVALAVSVPPLSPYRYPYRLRAALRIGTTAPKAKQERQGMADLRCAPGASRLRSPALPPGTSSPWPTG